MRTAATARLSLSFSSTIEHDGSVAVETAAKTDWTMLSALAKQSTCAGEIQRGLPGSN